MPQLVRWIARAAMAGLFLVAVGNTSSFCSAQTIQQPVVRFFNSNSSFSVPDGGTIRLGGVNRSQTGSISRGVPGLSGIPGLNRGFRNQAIGRSTTSGQASAKADLIISSELEAQVMAEALRRQAIRQQSDPNGSVDVQKKADFISRHIGK